MKNFIWILALIISSGMYAQEGGNLAGTIKDNEVFDEGVVFAEVRLRDTEFSTQTNFRGNFEFKGLTAGSYLLEVSYAGYETLEIPVEVKDGESTQITGAMSAKKLSLEDLSSVMSETRKNSGVTSDMKSPGEK
ncbi:carboxypeptidase-like regulatory domain-containing protein [Muriicola sp.]|uniref:carboxypeptidase-like regulatory domain-containing protein n=1 Tax=Muriicola sp. TaxID=2020856 RepID=UPI00356B33C6